MVPEWEPSNEPRWGVIPESSACGAVRGAPSAGRPDRERDGCFATTAVATLDRGWAPELVVVGPRGRLTDAAGEHLPKRIALWTFILVYPKDGQAPVTDNMGTAMTSTVDRKMHTLVDPERRCTQIDVFADPRNRTGTNIPPTTIAASQTRIPRR